MDRGEHLLDALWAVMNKKRTLDRNEWKTDDTQDLNPTELLCIEYLGQHSNVNATRLAEAFCITTGATSKLTKKLLTKGFLLRYQKLENRKEVYFRLSERGEALYQVLSGIRERLNQRDRPLFDRLSDDQYKTILDFTRSYSEHLDRISSLRRSGTVEKA